jgi:hypothetical protein
MSNELVFDIFINAFSRCYHLILGHIVDESKWRLHFFFKVNHIIIWLMFKQGVNILLFENIFIVLELGRNLMLFHFKVLCYKNIYQIYISILNSLMKAFNMTNKYLKYFDPCVSPKVFSCLIFYVCPSLLLVQT